MKNKSELKETFQHGDAAFPMNYYEGTYDEIYLHWHEEMEIIYIESGCGTLFIDFKPYEFTEGDFLIIPRDCIHAAQMKTTAKTYTIVFHINFLMSFIPDIIQIKFINPLKNKDFSLPVVISSSNQQYSQISMTILSMMTLLKEKTFGYELLIKSNFYQLLYLLLNAQKETLTLKNRNSRELKNVEKIKKIVTYVDENYHLPLTIEETATLLGFSNHYFCHFFKRQTGHTFFEYLNRYRIEKAKHLLINTNDSVTEIAYQTGFQDLSYFIRTFKKIVIASPAAYRKLYANQVNEEISH